MPTCPLTIPFHQWGSLLSKTVIVSPRLNDTSPSSAALKSYAPITSCIEKECGQKRYNFDLIIKTSTDGWPVHTCQHLEIRKQDTFNIALNLPHPPRQTKLPIKSQGLIER